MPKFLQFFVLLACASFLQKQGFINTLFLEDFFFLSQKREGKLEAVMMMTGTKARKLRQSYTGGEFWHNFIGKNEEKNRRKMRRAL